MLAHRSEHSTEDDTRHAAAQRARGKKPQRVPRPLPQFDAYWEAFLEASSERNAATGRIPASALRVAAANWGVPLPELRLVTRMLEDSQQAEEEKSNKAPDPPTGVSLRKLMQRDVAEGRQ